MNDIRYEIIIYWSEDDQSFITEVPELPGCTADGKSYSSALENTYQVIREWLEIAREENRSIPEPGRKLSYVSP